MRTAAIAMSHEEIASFHDLLVEYEQQQDLTEEITYFRLECNLDFHYQIIKGS